MIAVSDTSPICYLVLIGEIDVLPQLFTQVLIPNAVLMELRHEDAPLAVRNWACRLPARISVRENLTASGGGIEKLQLGEWAAISLVESTAADIVLLDENGREGSLLIADYGWPAR